MGIPASKYYVTTELSNWQSISRICYGDESYADLIRLANPVIFEPIAPNLLLTIPIVPLFEAKTEPVEIVDRVYPQPGRIDKVPFKDQDDVTIIIGGVALSVWTTVTLKRSVDAISTLTFTSPFEPNDPNFRALLKPLSFELIQVFVGGNSFFFGRMLPVAPRVSADSRIVEVSCYSYVGTLSDCTVAYNQKKDWVEPINLFDLTRELIRPFAINVIEPATLKPAFPFVTNSENPFNSDPTGEYSFYKTFEKVSVKTTKKILTFLVGLAAQRKLVITDNANGDLVYSHVNQNGVPVAHLTEGNAPLIEIGLDFDTQGWYSDITGVEGASTKTSFINTYIDSGKKSDMSNFTIHNEFLPGVYRPYVFRVKDSDGPVVDAVRSKYARMLANVVTYMVNVVGWRDPSNRLWKPNTLIDVTYPSAMIYEKYRFIIKSVELTRDANNKTARLELGLPGSYTGTPPKELPWLK